MVLIVVPQQSCKIQGCTSSFHGIWDDWFLFPVEFWVASPSFCTPSWLFLCLWPMGCTVDILRQSAGSVLLREVQESIVQPTWWECRCESVKCLHDRWFVKCLRDRWFLKNCSLEERVLTVSKLISGKYNYFWLANQLSVFFYCLATILIR